MKIISRKDAQAQGLKWYYIKPCRFGHIAERSVSSKHCRECYRIKGNEKYARGLGAIRKAKSDFLIVKGTESRIISRKSARQIGLNLYFTGKSCKNNHLNDRRVSNGQCITCEKLAEERHKKNNPQSGIERTKRYRQKHPGCDLPHISKRRASKKNAIPRWLTKEDINEIKNIYKMSTALSAAGVKHQVDHIHPLQHKSICGLHVPWNLQILTKSNNLHKKNKFTPFFLTITEIEQVQQHFTKYFNDKTSSH